MLTPWSTTNTAVRTPDGSTTAYRQQPSAPLRVAATIPSRAADAPVLHLLVVDDDDPVREGCCQIAEKMGFAVRGAANIPDANAILRFEKVDILLLDLKLPGGNALDLLEDLKKLSPATQVVIMTAYATVSSAVRAMKIGADNYLTKPFALEELTTILSNVCEERQLDVESRRLRERLRTESSTGPLIGQSPEMEKLYRILSKVCNSVHPVLIQGEAGTGKETVARFIHFSGIHARRPFVPVDCGSPNQSLIENELFGYMKGAFAGAGRTKESLLSSPDGGTIFLDEVGELSLELQSRLLRALQDRQFKPLGAVNPVNVNVRILAASSRDLGMLVEQGRFRRDLYLRLSIVNLRLPPLRERSSDIPLLAMHFIERFNANRAALEPGKTFITKPEMFSDEALRLLTLYDWPGNVAELEKAVMQACSIDTGPVLSIADLTTQLKNFHSQLVSQKRSTNGLPTAVSLSLVEGSSALSETSGDRSTIVTIADMERQAILNSIRQLDGDKLKAAKLLGIGKTTLYRKLKEYGISLEG